MDIKILASSSKGNCYLVGDGKSRLLLDAGIPFAQIQAGCGFMTGEIAGCLVSHIHDDHSHAVKDLSRRGIKCYGTREMAEAGMPVEPVKTLTIYKTGGFTFQPFEAVHDVECYGYLIQSIETGERLIYLTDTAGIKYDFDRIDYWLIEANYSLDIIDQNVANGMDRERANRVINTHMSIEKLKYYFERYPHLDAKEIYLIHLSDDNSDAAAFKEAIERTTGVPVTIA